MEKIRSFIAIELTDDIKDQLGMLEAQLQSDQLSAVKWVDPNSIHLTLKFLGDVAIDKISEISGAMEEAAQGISSFYLEIRELGVFPNLRRVQVVWVGLSGEIESLSRLQKNIDLELAHLGFAKESRTFTPHLTIARIRDRATSDERQRFGQIIASTKFEAGNIEVNTISLMKSQLTKAGAIYSRISSVILMNN